MYRATLEATPLPSLDLRLHAPSPFTQDLCVHQTETGRPVTDAVVQEVCKLRPDMIGLSLRDCVEVGRHCREPTNNLRTQVVANIKGGGGGGEAWTERYLLILLPALCSGRAAICNDTQLKSRARHH